jgi:hypothetical protein
MLDLAAIPTDKLRGMAQSAIGQFEGAERTLRAIISRIPGGLDTMRKPARVQQSQGLRRASLATARRAVVLAPNDWRAQSVRDATLARWADQRFVDALPDPLFLCGFPRSSTTMTENVLAAIAGTITSDEEPVLAGAARLATELSGSPSAPDTMAALDGLTDDQLTQIRSEYWKSVCRLVSPEAIRAEMFVDKTPLRFAHVLLLNRIFPRCRVIYVVRDPRDVCRSCFFEDFAVGPSLVEFLTLEATGDTHAEVLVFWLRARTRLTMPWMELRSEDTVADFESHARRVVDFVGRPWSDDVLRFHEKASGRSIRTPNSRTVTERVHTRALGKWARHEKHLGRVIERVRPHLGSLGYEA